MAQRQLSWGNAEFIFERPIFQAAFQIGRNCYFYEMEGERTLTDEHLLTVIASKDESGRYQIDFETLDHPADGAEELLGTLIGYLSAPLIPESESERAERFSVIVEMIQD